MRKQSKQSISLLQRKIWQEVRRIILRDHPHNCYTCPAKNLEGQNLQVGHLWAKASLGANLKYDLRVLRIQCFRCNINFGGNGAEFYSRMLHEKGKKYMDNLEYERRTTVKAHDWYIDLLEKYAKL